jgi:hypothetical protein
MKYRAVIFDLFGTLKENFIAKGYETAFIEVATALS